jgi:transcription initiation factor IIF auxiliary subunit
MNHNHDYDRDKDQEDVLTEQGLKEILEHSYAVENELMRRYMMTAEQIHHNDKLKERLQNFAEGNAKRTQQLLDEISEIH